MIINTKSIDINADLGEGFPWDVLLLDRVSSANVCCGEHAGDPATIAATLRAAAERNVVVGAHPGYADRENFGRRERSIDRKAVRDLIVDQVDRLIAIADSMNRKVHYIKPHGALYNQARRDREIALGVIDAAYERSFPILGIPGGALEELARERGVRFVAEGFPERRYQADGSLVARDRADAIVFDPHEIEDQVHTLIDRGVETLCVHGDAPHAVAVADLLRSICNRSNIQVRSFINT